MARWGPQVSLPPVRLAMVPAERRSESLLLVASSKGRAGQRQKRDLPHPPCLRPRGSVSTAATTAA
eukprot:CAMPEP_0117679856 /NCGR_PEP_ID=MMETSP0804-20121206/18031_1 /TAXON_ID=1074897 /ORGANISM="Tetraselmis astigmatica, Strain CCMP880" /LENGTH=65 /DNA_ID=CAMNT_0005489293 /DNA_START=1242 /DNA_END=1439 /DNA_ORIENTATION=-